MALSIGSGWSIGPGWVFEGGPTPGTFIITISGDFITTISGDFLITT
jgi:hypothetical protein